MPDPEKAYYVRRRGVSVSLDLPDIHTYFPDLIAAEKRAIIFAGHHLDSIYNWWGTSLHTDELTTRFEQSLASDAVPQKEKDELTERLEDRVTQITAIKTTIKQSVQEIEEDKRPKADTIKTLVDAIELFTEEHDGDEQWVALCEALGEARGTLTEQRVRQRIAQHTLEELFVKFDYANLKFAGEVEEETTTVGTLELEKAELISALTGNLWTSNERNKYKRAVRRTRQAIAQEYSDEIGVDLKKLLDIALGDGPKRMTLVDILETQERVLTDLSDEGAFEFELEDPEEEDED